MNHRWKSIKENLFFCRILKLLKNINTQNWGSSLKRTLFFSKLSNDERLTAEFFTITWVSSTGKIQYMTVVFKYSLPSENEQQKIIIWHLGDKCENKNYTTQYKICGFYSIFTYLGSNFFTYSPSSFHNYIEFICLKRIQHFINSHKYIFAILISVQSTQKICKSMCVCVTDSTLLNSRD